MLYAGENWTHFALNNAAIQLGDSFGAHITKRSAREEQITQAHRLIGDMESAAGMDLYPADLRDALTLQARQNPNSILHATREINALEPDRLARMPEEIQAAMISAVIYSIARAATDNRGNKQSEALGNLESARLASYQLQEHTFPLIDAWSTIAKDTNQETNTRVTALKFLDLQARVGLNTSEEIRDMVSALIDIAIAGQEPFADQAMQGLDVNWKQFTPQSGEPVGIFTARQAAREWPDLVLLSAPNHMRFAYWETKFPTVRSFTSHREISLYSPIEMWEHFVGISQRNTQLHRGKTSIPNSANAYLADVIFSLAEAVIVHSRFAPAFAHAGDEFAATSVQAKQSNELFNALPEPVRSLINVGETYPSDAKRFVGRIAQRLKRAEPVPA